MTKILIVDDNPSRYGDVLNRLEGVLDVHRDVAIVSNTRDALASLQNTKFDILILDIFIPSVPWGEPIEDGGVVLLEHLDEDETLKLPSYIIGITASSTPSQRVEAIFQSKPWVLLNTFNGVQWEERLLSLVRHVVGVEREQDDDAYKTDICFIAALKNPEFEALCRADLSLDEPVLLSSSISVQTGSLVSNGDSLSVVASHCLRMGSTESALLTSALIAKYRPRIVCLVGICAGFEEKVEYGDVIVANPCWDYTMSSKITVFPDGKRVVSISPDQIGVDEGVVTRFDLLSSDAVFFSSLHGSWPGEKPRGAPQLFVGPSASGPAVIADSSVFSDLRRDQNRNTIGLEMEAYGVYCAVRKSTRPRPIMFSVKSVCDYANFLKDDKYQKYAAYVSASVSVEFLKRFGKDICRGMA